MTADEIDDELCAARNRERLRLSRLYKAGEVSAYNTAALCLTAFNAPQRFPKKMSDAFISGDGGSGDSSDFAAIAEAFNRTFEQKKHGGDNDSRRT